MSKYLLRRLLQMIPLLLGVSLLSFTLMHLAPGGPLAAYTQNPTLRAEDIRRIEESLGLHQPIHIQYGKWALGMFTGNWGRSYRDGRQVTHIISERMPATLVLMGSAFSIAVIVGMLVGILGAVRRYSLFDYLATTGAMLALSLPTFWFGLMVIFVFSVQLGWLPSGGMATLGMPFSLVDRLYHLIAPSWVLGLVLVATWSRYTRSSMLEVIHQDFIRVARAKGVKESRVIYYHALRNALLPLITLAGLQLPLFFSGALVTETIFTWPGMGRLFVDSLEYRDYPVVLAMLMVSAFCVLLGNLLADLLYGIADPRVRLE